MRTPQQGEDGHLGYAVAAGIYLTNGWQPLPLLSSGKGVVPPGFTGYDARGVTEEQARKWSEVYPAAGTALHLTGEIGLDVDNYANPDRNLREGDAAESLRQLEADLGPLPPTVSVSSRLLDDDYDGQSGIRLFRLPDEHLALIRQPVWKSEAAPGIEVIRFGHRQVVVWPSRHPKRGSVYAVLDQRTEEVSEGPLPPPDSLPVLPLLWVEYLLKFRETRPASDTAHMLTLDVMWTAGAPCPTVQAVLDRALQVLPDARHDTARNALLRLSRLGEQGHRGVSEAVACLRREFIRCRAADKTSGSWRAEDEWDRMLPRIPGILEGDGRTPEAEKHCCVLAEEAPWPPIVEITQGVSERFPLDALPAGMRAAVEEVARTRMVDPAIPGAAFLGAAAGAVGAHLSIRINSSWTTAGNLYIAVVAETGDGKTPGTAPALPPMQDLEEKLRDEAAEAKRTARTQIDLLKRELKELSGAKSPDVRRIMHMQRQMGTYEEDLHRDPRLVVDDVTPERLAEILHDNDGRIVAFNDEGALFAHLLGLYTEHPNLGPFLKAWDGSRLTVDRKGGNGKERTALVINYPLMTMFAAVQPRMVVQLGEQRHQLLRERGVIGRVLFVWPAPMAGHRKLRSQPHEVRLDKVSAWNRTLTKTASDLEETFLGFTPGAYDLFVDWHDQVEELLPAGEVYADIKDFVVKIREQVARIAGLFAFLEHDPDEEPDPYRGGIEVREDHVSRAVELGEYFLRGAFAVVESWQGHPIGLARRLVARIRKDGGSTFTVRDACRWTKAKKDAVLPALELLQHHGYLRPADPRAGFGRLDDRQVVGRVSPTVLVNPTLWSE